MMKKTNPANSVREPKYSSAVKVTLKSSAAGGSWLKDEDNG